MDSHPSATEKRGGNIHSLIIANGTLPHPGFVRALAKFAEIIVCADGGANHARKLGIIPNVIIGDFDSINPATRLFYGGTEQIIADSQESTDLEKAISYCIGRGITAVDIVGATGDRIDHTASCLGCFKKYGEKIHIRIIDPSGELTMIRKEINLIMREHEKLSLIPLERCSGITTKNLRYPLRNETLEPGVRDGISNEALSAHVNISVESGALLLYRFHGSAWRRTADL